MEIQNAFMEDMKWGLDNYKNLQLKFRDLWVAIVNKEVVVALQVRIKKLVDPELDLKLDYGELVRLSILGFKDLLETFAIHFDIRSCVAYLEG